MDSIDPSTETTEYQQNKVQLSLSDGSSKSDESSESDVSSESADSDITPHNHCTKYRPAYYLIHFSIRVIYCVMQTGNHKLMQISAFLLYMDYPAY